MPKLISIAVEHPENFLQQIALRAIAVDADGNVWRGEATVAPLGPTTITWTPVASHFPASGEPARLSGGPPDPEACTCASGFGADPKCPQHGKGA